jgi:hypothetical protein
LRQTWLSSAPVASACHARRHLGGRTAATAACSAIIVGKYTATGTRRPHGPMITFSSWHRATIPRVCAQSRPLAEAKPSSTNVSRGDQLPQPITSTSIASFVIVPRYRHEPKMVASMLNCLKA